MIKLRINAFTAALWLALACEEPGQGAESEHDFGDAGQGDATMVVGDEPEALSFAVTECKDRGAPHELFTGRDTDDYRGLQCVAWKSVGQSTKVDLINFSEGCGFQGTEPTTLWVGTATRDAAGNLVLRVTWDFEAPSACGNCLHDFSFELSGVRSETALPVTIETRSCSGCEGATTAAMLPMDERSEGIVCRHSEDGTLSELAPGSLHGLADASTCEAGLVATKVDGIADEVCLSACGPNEECPAAELLTCEANACVLSQPW